MSVSLAPRWLLTIVLLAGAFAAAPLQARGFMWEAKKGDDRVLLLGTIHVGRSGQTELTAAQTQRVREAAAIALEADVFDARRTLAAFQRYAFIGGDADGLDRTLPTALRTRLEKLLPRYGLSPDAAWRLKPWALANNLVVLEASRLGFSPALSTEAQLFALARQRSVPILEIESVEKQLALFDSAPADLQLAYLEQAVTSVESGAGEREIRALLDSWRNADAGAMTQRLTTMRNSHNAGERWVTEQVIDGRHPAMLAAIERLAASGKLHLVAVGTLHFFGPNGLLDGLRTRGYTITPLR
ncbi:MAG: TraB/GumN family protein [Burkholderiaceae bacterium]|jgi:hypothetical protein|nr:TraB/GumN family protein [Burkholderiaceae bacterium]